MTSKNLKSWMVLLTIILLLVSACTSSSTPDTPPAAATATTAPQADVAKEATATTETEASQGETAAGEFDLDAILANAGSGECQEPAGDPLIIGYAPDFSDLGGFADIPGSQAAGYMVELINCAGGLNGTPIKYIVEPADAGDLELTLRSAQDLVDAGAHAVLGPPFSDVGLPLLNVLGGKIPAIHVASTEAVLSDPSIYSFLMTFDDEAQGNAAGKWAIKNGYKRAVTMTSSDFPYFEANPKAFTAAFTAGGGEVVSDYSYSIGDDDYSSQVNEIAALDPAPEVLYTANIMPFIDTLIGQLRAAGLTDLVIVGPDGFDATRVIDGAETNGAVYTTHGFPSEGSRMKTFLDAYEAEKGEALETITFGPLGADAVLVIAQAFLAGGGQLDSKAIGDAIVNTPSFQVISVDTISYQGPDGPVGTPIKNIYIVQNIDGVPTLIDQITPGE